MVWPSHLSCAFLLRRPNSQFNHLLHQLSFSSSEWTASTMDLLISPISDGHSCLSSFQRHKICITFEVFWVTESKIISIPFWTPKIAIVCAFSTKTPFCRWIPICTQNTPNRVLGGHEFSITTATSSWPFKASTRFYPHMECVRTLTQPGFNRPSATVLCGLKGRKNLVSG